MKKQNYVGIDVSAKTFTVIIDRDGDRGEAFDLANDSDGLSVLIIHPANPSPFRSISNQADHAASCHS